MLCTVRGHSHWVSSVKFDSSSHTLATAGWDGRLKLWQLEGLHTDDSGLTVDSDNANSHGLGSGGSHSRWQDGTQSWIVDDVMQENGLSYYQGVDTLRSEHVTLSSLPSVYDSATGLPADAVSARCLRTITLPPAEPIYCIARDYQPSSLFQALPLRSSVRPTSITTGYSADQLREWNMETGVCTRQYMGHKGAVYSVQRDRDILISGSADRTVRVCCILYTLSFIYPSYIFSAEEELGPHPLNFYSTFIYIIISLHS